MCRLERSQQRGLERRESDTRSPQHSQVKEVTTTRTKTTIGFPLTQVYHLLKHVLYTALEGQRLPQAIIVFILHLFLHTVVILTRCFQGKEDWRLQASTTLLFLNGVVVACGSTLLVALYRHSVQTIFNRKIPSNYASSLGVHLSLLRPLEVIFRYLTFRFRVLPDILVLGEVRCGTTTLCQHLSSLKGCHEPFCLWKHPELDKKETFYFVGHYLGFVHPSFYSMCFPLVTTRWFSKLLGRPFFTFDGCAQYLTSPTAPRLISKAYKDAGLPPPILVACVRDPVEQAVSWWRYENNAMQWGRGMGLIEWNTDLRSNQYPPTSLGDAIDFSHSPETTKLFQDAETLFENESDPSFIAPSWAITWPAGQLAGIGRNGAFASNINRYETIFEDVFGPIESTPPTNLVPDTSSLKYVNVVPLEFLRDQDKLSQTLDSISKQLERRNSGKHSSIVLDSGYASKGVHRNAGAKLPLRLEPSSSARRRLEKLFSHDTKELEQKCGMMFDWRTSSANNL